MSAEISSWVRGRRAVAEHKHRVVFLTVALLSLSSCGVADRVSYENGAEQLRVQVHRIVDASAKDVSMSGDPSVEAVQRQLERHVPAPPGGQVLQLAGSAAPGRARVGFAVTDKIDGYGPGGVTVTLRMCVQVTMAPPPDLVPEIEDTDCSAVTPVADSVVEFEP